MIDSSSYSIEEILVAIKNGEVSPMALVAEFSTKIKKSNLNAFITLLEDYAMKKAEESVDRIRNNEARPLEGLVISVKDMFCMDGILTTAASKMLDNFIPDYTAEVVEKLENAGAIIIGKNNQDEFAMGSSNESSYFGPVKNPLNIECVPGGSSGGSAAAVAGGLSFASIGTDTGGSVCQPASFCGIVGMRPSYSRVSRYGVIPLASSFDQAGVFGKTVQDVCIVMDQIMGFSVKDARSFDIPAPVLSKVKANGKVRVGYIKEHFNIIDAPAKEMWSKALDALRSEGSEIIPIDLNQFGAFGNDGLDLSYSWLGIYYTLQPVEAYSNFAKYDGIRYGSYVDAPSVKEAYIATREQFGDQVKKRLILGSHILYNRRDIYDKAIDYRAFVKHQFNHLFDTMFDVIIYPTSPNTAFKIGNKHDDPVKGYAEDIFTVLAPIVQSPAISVPFGSDNGLPLGINVMAKRFNEEIMISVAKFLEARYKLYNQGK